MLLGREVERQALEGVLASARAGRSTVLALVGEPGIGKTALLDFAAERAGDLRILRARGVEAESQVPFAGLLALLRPALRLAGRIPSPQAEALESALALRPAAAGERFAVGAATLSLLAAYADEAPSLLIVDDAHLLDPSTAEALRFALRRLLAEPLGVLLAVRADEPSLLDGADLQTLVVGGLDRNAARALLGPASPEVVARMYSATAGNPLALIELGADPAHLEVSAIDAPIPVPAQVARAFARRAATLDPAARRLLVLLAAGDSDDLPTLERAAAGAGLDLNGLSAVEATGLIRLEPGRAVFRHPLARAAAYAQSSAEERRAAHRAVAAALPEGDADRRAWHLAEATVGTDAMVAAALEQAAVHARERSAYAVAAAAFERAARLSPADPERGRLLLAAADAAWLAGQADRAGALLDAARASTAEPGPLIRIEQLRGQIATRQGPVARGQSILAAAAERAAPADPELAVDMLAEAVDAGFFAGDARGMADSARRIQELMPAGAAPRTRFVAAMATGMAAVFAGEGRTGIAAIRAAVEQAVAAPQLRSDTRLLSSLVMGPLWVRESGAGRGLIEAAMTTARTRAALGVLPWVLNLVARDHAAGDAWSSAAAEYDEALRIADDTGQDTERAFALAGLAGLEARQGRHDESRAHAAEARALCARLGLGLYDLWVVRALADLELGCGRAADAAAHLEECRRIVDRLGIRDVDVSPDAELVDAYLRLGREDDATAAAERLDAEATAKGQPWSCARAARCRGLLAGSDAFAGHFDTALALHARTPDTFERGVTHLGYGARLRRGRRRIDAREQLHAARDIFERLGATPWSELTRTELLATGEVARRRDPSTLDALTRQEFHIAQVLAAGQTTREAAAALFLSPKTVEYHLRSVYRKLGVSSRTELAAALAGESAAPIA